MWKMLMAEKNVDNTLLMKCNRKDVRNGKDSNIER